VSALRGAECGSDGDEREIAAEFTTTGGRTASVAEDVVASLSTESGIRHLAWRARPGAVSDL
jgi:hypothetical protein